MALVTATITVDFTANYAGAHRVCWTIQGSGNPYDCTTVVNCVGGGTTCQAIFTADVNTTSCDGTVTFEGYVQAACEDISSLNGRLPFTVDFVPNPICNRVEVTCAYGEIQAIQINAGGQEFMLGDSVQIIRNGGDTQVDNAIISINAVGDGIINSISGLISAGLGYLATEIITVNDLGGGGTLATITIDSVGGSGEVLTYTLTTNGSDYVGPFSFSGGSGAGVIFDIQAGVDYDVYGSILSFTITDGGAYDIVPTINILTGTGSGFNGTVLLSNCATWNDIGLDCDGNLVFLTGGVAHGETVAICLDDNLWGPLPTGYTAVESGCCIPEDTVVTPICVDYHIENLSGGPVNVSYTGCNGIFFTANVANGATVPVCAIIDGVLDPQVSGVTITTSFAACGAA